MSGIIGRMLNMVKRVICSLMSSPVLLSQLAKVFRACALTGRGSHLCLRNGFLPVPVDYHSPIPDIDDLEARRIWDERSELKGIDFKIEEQIRMLKRLGKDYSHECCWPLTATSDPSEFYLVNPSFSYGCAVSTHCVIRHFRPMRVIEIGSGMSSRVISRALEMNRDHEGSASEYVVVDPYPSAFVKSGALRVTKIIEARVELMDSAYFEVLKANDILFIDSGHCVRIGGDVNYLVLDVLPRLKPGVIVHLHDISIPYEYPKAYATNESFRQFWTEQYLLHAFLCFNTEFEILLAMNYLMTDYSELFRRSFPHDNPGIHRSISGSFWIRRGLHGGQL